MPKSKMYPDDLKSRFKSPYIRKRLAAVRGASNELERRRPDPEILHLLEQAARQDESESVRQKALESLRSYVGGLPLKNHRLNKANKIRVTCSKGHTSLYDKKEICGSRDEFMRTRVFVESKDDILIKCKRCGEAMVVQVDCEDAS